MSDQARPHPPTADDGVELSANIQAHLGRAAKSPNPGDEDGYRTRDWSLFFFFRILTAREMEKTKDRLAEAQGASGFQGLDFVASTGSSAWRTVLLDLAQPSVLNAGLAEKDGSEGAGDTAAPAFRAWLEALVLADNRPLIEKVFSLFSASPGQSPSSETPAAAREQAAFGEAAEDMPVAPAAFGDAAGGMPMAPAAYLNLVLSRLNADHPGVLAELRANLAPTAADQPLEMLTRVAVHEVLRQLGSGFRAPRDHEDAHARPAPLAIVRSEKSEDLRLAATEKEAADRTPVSIAFSFPGLQALKLHEDTLASFPEPFRQGMAARARRLRDIGPSAPENWEGELGLKSVHGYFTTGSALGAPEKNEAFWRALRADIAAFNEPASAESVNRRALIGGLFRLLGLEIVHIELGQNPYLAEDGDVTECPGRREHFGFRDGISQPFVDLGLGDTLPGGSTPSRRGSWIPVAPGEIFLHGNDEGGRPHRFPVNATLRNGSTFLVFRKLEQDVWGFRTFLAAERPNDAAAQDRLGAQFVGRWMNGTPLALSREGERAACGKAEAWLNDFRYSADDPNGRKCPLGAHIRRANPRDTGGRNDVRHHRLLRRGISYGGPLLPEGAADDGEKRGMLFVAANARIDVQFELIQSDWLNSGEFLGQAGLGRCPLTGMQDKGPGARFLEGGAAAPVIGIPNFVTMRGGDYFFAPGIPALKAIAAGSDLKPDEPLPHGGAAMGATTSPELFGARRIGEYGRRLLQGDRRVIRVEPLVQGPLPVEKIAFVGQHGDVTQVLRNPLSPDGRNMRFSVCPYREAGLRMSRGDLFLVGTDVAGKTGKAHKRLEKVLNLGWDKFSALVGDPDKVLRATVQERLETALRRVAGGRHIDLVDDLAVPAAYGVIDELYGAPGPSWMTELAAALPFSRQHVSDLPPDWIAAFKGERPANPALTTMQVWMAIMVADLLSNLQSQRPLQALARQAATEALTHLDLKLLEWRQKLLDPAHKRRPNTLAEAFVINEKEQAATLKKCYPRGSDWTALYYRDVAIILLEIIGSTLTIVPLTFASVMTFLLNARIDLSFLLPRLKPGGVTRLIYEAERLNPNTQVRMRSCGVTTPIGTDKIVAGDFVAALIGAANLDPRAFPDPTRFSLKPFDGLSDGPERDGDNYLLFGVDKDSNKRCWGREKVALPVLQECLLAAGRLQGLRRVAGAGGEPQKLVAVTVGLAARFTRILAKAPEMR